VSDYAASHDIDNLNFIEGDIYALPFPDAHFDAVFGSAVLGSVADSTRVAQEMVRVLKPGGVIGLKEFDHGSDLIWPQSPLIARSIELYHGLRAENNHDDKAGRKLKEFIVDNGCKVEYVHAYFDQQTDQQSLQKFVVRNNGLVEEMLASQYIELGWATTEELDAQAEEWLAFAANPAAIYLSAWLEAVGRKPG